VIAWLGFIQSQIGIGGFALLHINFKPMSRGVYVRKVYYCMSNPLEQGMAGIICPS
jgi:hypothetical protein